MILPLRASYTEFSQRHPPLSCGVGANSSDPAAGRHDRRGQRLNPPTHCERSEGRGGGLANRPPGTLWRARRPQLLNHRLRRLVDQVERRPAPGLWSHRQHPKKTRRAPAGVGTLEKYCRCKRVAARATPTPDGAATGRLIDDRQREHQRTEADGEQVCGRAWQLC